MHKYLLLVFLFFALTAIKSQSLMTVGEIYDYNIGDVFITKFGGYSGPPTYFKKVILNRYNNPANDSVMYIYDAYSYTPPSCPNCTAIYDTIYGDTLIYTNLTDTMGAGLGAKIHYWNGNCIDTAGYTGVWLDTVINNPVFCNKLTTRISRMENGPQLVDSCYSYFEPFYGYEEYGRGIGQISYYYNTCSTGIVPNCELGAILLYYKKGNDSCGTQPIMSGINDLKLTNTLSVFPNPFFTETHFYFFEEQINSSLIITNILGEEVKKLFFSGRQLTLEKGELTNGIYFAHIKNGNKSALTKLIIQ
jgi:hypothetical protein